MLKTKKTKLEPSEMNSTLQQNNASNPSATGTQSKTSKRQSGINNSAGKIVVVSTTVSKQVYILVFTRNSISINYLFILEH